MLKDELADALRDENGLRPTENAMTVIMHVVAAIDGVDIAHGNKPAVPSATDYARGVIHSLVCGVIAP